MTCCDSLYRNRRFQNGEQTDQSDGDWPQKWRHWTHQCKGRQKRKFFLVMGLIRSGVAGGGDKQARTFMALRFQTHCCNVNSPIKVLLLRSHINAHGRGQLRRTTEKVIYTALSYKFALGAHNILRCAKIACAHRLSHDGARSYCKFQLQRRTTYCLIT